MMTNAELGEQALADRAAWFPSPLWAKNRAELVAALVQLLSTRHAGKANGIGAEELATLLCVTERMLRSLITEARDQGIAISATPDTGYYIAQTPDEIEECCRFLRSRAMKSLHLEAQLRRIPLPDLLGQLHLPT